MNLNLSKSRLYQILRSVRFNSLILSWLQINIVVILKFNADSRFLPITVVLLIFPQIDKNWIACKPMEIRENTSTLHTDRVQKSTAYFCFDSVLTLWRRCGNLTGSQRTFPLCAIHNAVFHIASSSHEVAIINSHGRIRAIIYDR